MVSNTKILQITVFAITVLVVYLTFTLFIKGFLWLVASSGDLSTHTLRFISVVEVNRLSAEDSLLMLSIIEAVYRQNLDAGVTGIMRPSIIPASKFCAADGDVAALQILQTDQELAIACGATILNSLADITLLPTKLTSFYGGGRLAEDSEVTGLVNLTVKIHNKIKNHKPWAANLK
jgi:hypothetical protein